MTKLSCKKREIPGFFLLPVFLVIYLPIVILLLLWYIVGRLIFGNDKLVITGEKRYVFIERSTVVFKTKRIKNLNYKNNDGNLEIKWENNVTTITIYGVTPKFDGFAWDGCSPKFQIFDLVIGTPDGAVISKTEKPATYYASMVHDILYQYHWFTNSGYTKKQCDEIFLDEMRKQQFRLAYIYYLGVRIFGFIYWFTKRPNLG